MTFIFRKTPAQRLARARLRYARACLEAAQAHLERVHLEDVIHGRTTESQEFLDANEAAWKAQEEVDRAVAHAKAPLPQDSM